MRHTKLLPDYRRVVHADIYVAFLVAAIARCGGIIRRWPHHCAGRPPGLQVIAGSRA
jgi:hypothetical protein